jgi:hypothetical protein
MAMCSLAPVQPALAQSPSPGHQYYAVAPGNRTLTHDGVVVEALGMDGCDSRRVPARNDIVYYVNHSEPVWLEVTPQGYCNDVATYKTEISNMLDYIDNNTADADEGDYFAGAMLDEETGYGFGVSALNNLNTAVQNQVVSTPGATWWSVEGFSSDDSSHANGCTWQYADYEDILLGGFQAQQIIRQCNIRLVNHEPTVETLVTWNAGYDPGDTQVHASDPIDAPCYVDAAHTWRWSNHWVPT